MRQQEFVSRNDVRGEIGVGEAKVGDIPMPREAHHQGGGIWSK